MRFFGYTRLLLSEFRSRPWRYRARSACLWSFHLVNAACIGHLFSTNVAWLRPMSGPSMLPTMDIEGEMALENMFYYFIWPFARGDLVTLSSPSDPSRIICKRVAGLPGDIVCVDPTGLKAPSTEHVVVPNGHLWLVGDNATIARDSRDYGPASMALIRGKLVARVWPLNKFTIFRDPTTPIDERLL